MFFFFYGTLLDGSDNPVAASVHARLRAIGPAAVRGALHAIPDPEGWYPALLSGDGLVHGRLYEAAAAFGESDLARLDAYEDYDPRKPERSLYLREAMTATAGDGSSCEVQAYRFNLPLPVGACVIDGGDFRAWLNRQGLQAFGGMRSG